MIQLCDYFSSDANLESILDEQVRMTKWPALVPRQVLAVLEKYRVDDKDEGLLSAFASRRSNKRLIEALIKKLRTMKSW